MTKRDRKYMQKDEISLADQLERGLEDRYGVMVTGDDLRSVLGYPSQDAFRQALSRKAVPVPVFSIDGRRGKFCLVKDVALWLAAQRERAVNVSGSPRLSLDQRRKEGGVT